MLNLDINLPEKFWPIFDGPARYRGAYGGRGGGKSIGFADMAIQSMCVQPMRFLCTRELQRSLRDSVFSLLQERIFKIGAYEAFDVGKEYMRSKIGGEFLFYGLRSNIAEIKGLHGIKRVWIEEAQGVSQASLDYLLPTIREEGSEIWAGWNPDDELDPIHHMLVTHRPHNARVVKINYYDNYWFPAVLEEERLRTKKSNPARYDWIWEGNFNINAEGAVYAKWINAREQAGCLRTDLYDPSLPVHTAWDIGFHDYTTIWFFQVARGEVRVIDYYSNNREGLQHYAEQIMGCWFIPDSMSERGKVVFRKGGPIDGLEHRRKYNYGNHWVPHDAAHKLFAAGGRSIVDQGKDFGVRMFVVAAISQQNQIAVARKTIEQCWFDPILCADGLRCLRKYEFEFDEEKQRYKDKPNHNVYSHGADAFEVLSQVWKSPIVEVAKPEARYLHDMKADEIFWPKNEIKRERI